MWQSERHGKWHSWKIVTETQSAALATIATVTNDKTGWWVAYGVSLVLLHHYILLSSSELIIYLLICARYFMLFPVLCKKFPENSFYLYI